MMKKTVLLVIFTVFVAALIVFSQKDVFAQSLTQRTSGGSVQIALILLNPEALYSGEDILFEVSMNTHSVPLDQYRMEELSFIRGKRGRLSSALAWESSKGGGHHRFGKLRFSGKDKSGEPIIGKGDKYLEVIIKNVGGISERVFRWDLPFKVGL